MVCYQLNVCRLGVFHSSRVTTDIWWNLLFRTFLLHGTNQMKFRFWKEISQSPLICKFDCTEKIWSGDPNPQNSSLSTIKPAHEEGLLKIVFSRNNSKDQCIFFFRFLRIGSIYIRSMFLSISLRSARKRKPIYSPKIIPWSRQRFPFLNIRCCLKS